MRIYGDLASGNCYKIKLLLLLLKLPHLWQHMDILAGHTRTPEFLALNANGKIPLLQEDDGFCVAESNAILCYLAEYSPYMPATSRERAHVMQWLFFEQYSHEPNIATARYFKRYLQQHEHPDLPARHAGGYRALAVMERQLAQQTFMAGAAFTIADIALYAYTHVAADGGFELQSFPQVQRWIRDIEARPDHVTMAELLADAPAA